MAEFCKECFVAELLDSKGQEDYRNGKLTLLMSGGEDFCEGCCEIKPVVVSVLMDTSDEQDVLYIEDITGTVGQWLAQDYSGIPEEAVDALRKAYDICAKELEGIFAV